MLDSENPATGRPDIFFSRHGLRSGWRVLLFLIVLAAVLFGLFALLSPFVHAAPSGPWRLLTTEAISSAGVVLATWFMARVVERKALGAYGLSQPGSWHRNAFTGLITGFAALSLLFGILVLFKLERVQGFALHGPAVWSYAALWGITFLLVAFSEEYISRGYLLFALTEGLGFWPAAFMVAVLFAVGHLGNRGEEAIGIGAAGAIGLLFAWTVRWTGSLWWAIGFHASWDWAESYFYGVADSGTLAQGRLLDSAPTGPSWLSGGSVGPEGSILILPLIGLLALVVRRTTRHSPPAGLARLPG